MEDKTVSKEVLRTGQRAFILMRARIRDGAGVGQDHSFFRWKDNGEIFDCELFKLIDIERGESERWKLKAFGYGQTGQEGSYGNGALYVNSEDLIPVKED